MITTEFGKTTIRTLDYKKVMPFLPKEAIEVLEEADMYADVSSILDAIAEKTSKSTVIKILEEYTKELKEKLEK